jgi:hypothetical protein
MNIDETIEEILNDRISCPRYTNCITGRAMSSEKCGDTCCIYGCSVYNEHSALYRIRSVNGNQKNADIMNLLRKAVKYQSKKANI